MEVVGSKQLGGTSGHCIRVALCHWPVMSKALKTWKFHWSSPVVETLCHGHPLEGVGIKDVDR